MKLLVPESVKWKALAIRILFGWKAHELYLRKHAYFEVDGRRLDINGRPIE